MEKFLLYQKMFVTFALISAANIAGASSGTITFEGKITSATCQVTGSNGASGSGQAINVKLGTVSADALTTAGQVASGTALSMELDCKDLDKLKTVSIAFDALGGSGIDSSNPSLLKVAAGGATGVGIGLFDKNNQMLNLSANPVITEDLTITSATGIAKMQLRAGYVANGAAVKPGAANGTLPFTVTYQ